MKKILIVEDNEDLLIIYRKVFSKTKDTFQVLEKDNAEAALSIIDDVNPDLMIIDISLPGMSGLELTQKIHHKYPSIKIIIATAHEPSRFYDYATNAGAQSVISKDIGVDALISMCKGMLRIP
jgi:DNA-binding NarL/FixJ family response regulator